MWWIYISVASGVFLSTLSTSAANVALPAIMASLHTNLVTAQWVISGYLLTILCLLPILGRLGDIFGNRKVFCWGFLLFFAGSLLCSISQSVFSLIGARVAQAIGAADIIAISNSVIVVNFPPEQRGKALGMVGASASLGGVTGPSIGGLMLGHWAWNAIFAGMSAMALVGYFSSLLFLPADKKRNPEPVDYGGVGLFTLSMVSLFFILSFGSYWSWLERCIGVFVWLVVSRWFVYYENRVSSPIIDFSILKNRTYVGGIIAGMTAWIVFQVNTVLLPFFLQEVTILSIAKIGLVMSVCPLLMCIFAPISGKLSDKFGSTVLTTCGLGLMGLGAFFSSWFDHNTAIGNILLAQIFVGLGNGIFQAPNNNRVMSAVVPGKLGIAGGINALFRFSGLIVGMTLVMAVLESQRITAIDTLNLPATDGFIHGYEITMGIAAAIAIFGAVISQLSGKSKLGFAVRN